MLREPVDDLQPIRQVADEVVGRDRGAELAEAGLAPERLHEAVEPVSERLAAEVLEAGACPRRVDELVGVDPGVRRHAGGA